MLLKFLAPCWIVLLVSTWFAVKSAARTRSNEDIRHEVSKFVNDHRKELWEGKSVMKSFSRETSKRKELIRLFRKAGMVLPREEGERKKLSSERHREEEQAVRSEPAERNGDERALQEDQQKRRKAVIGGNFSPIFRYPYMVTVKFKWSGNAKHTHTCGGSLIAPDIVLSAAHCYEASWGNPKVVVGDHDLTSSDDAGEEFDAKVLAIHPEYSSFFITSDIMLFQIINGQVSTHPPVRLNKDPSVPVANQKVDVIGWGTIDPQGQIGTDVLKETQLEAVPQDKCLQFGSSKIHGPDIICAADLDGKLDEDSCKGDSGGPLIIKGANFTQDVQIALVSHGPFPCAQPSPGMYTGISYFYEWISGYVCDVSVSPPPDFACFQPTISPAPTASTSPSLNPSSSFSPTVTKVPITLVIKLDKYPEDVSWYIIRQTNSSTIDIVKDAVYKKEQEYSNNPQNSIVYEYLYLIPDQSYLLVMDDSYGDGICCSFGQGYYFLYWGHENKNFLENLKIFKGDGNYQSIAVVPFNTTELYKNAPSLSPSLSYSPSTTKAPSTYPSSSMSPTITHTLVTLFIQFDNYPSDVSWEIRLANSTQTQPLFKGGNYYFDQTYNGQKNNVTETFHLPPNQVFEMHMFDSYGDGLCCTAGYGYYAIYLGKDMEIQAVKSDGEYTFGEVQIFDTIPPTMEPSTAPTSSQTPTLSALPSFRPTLSMSPSLHKILVTLFIQFDDFPNDVRWKIFSANTTNQELFFQGSNYSNSLRNTNITETFHLFPDQVYEIHMFDSYGDGLCCMQGNGYYAVYLGNDMEIQAVKSNGTYGTGEVQTFQTITPTLPPSTNPTSSTSPTSSLSPSLSPSTSFLPTASKVPLTLSITFDKYPSEVSWALYHHPISNKGPLANSSKFSYNLSHSTVNEIFYLVENKAFEFIIEDSYGDGICCIEGNGSYALYFGDESTGIPIFEAVGNYEFGRKHIFTATQPSMSPSLTPSHSQLPTTTSQPSNSPSMSMSPSINEVFVTLDIQLDKYAYEVDWQIYKANTDPTSSEPLVYGGNYDNDMSDKLVSHTFSLEYNTDYKFYIQDGHGDGICCSNGYGYAILYFGKKDDKTIPILNVDGKYGASGVYTFKTSPTPIITSAPTNAQPSFPNQSPYFAPTISPIPPTSPIVPYVNFTLVIRFDEKPLDLIWAIIDNNEINPEVWFSSISKNYSHLAQKFVYESISLPEGEYIFGMGIDFDDSSFLCCENGNGYVYLYQGTHNPEIKKFDEKNLVFWNNGTLFFKNFTVSVPKTSYPEPTPSPAYSPYITIEIFFDDWPFEISWGVYSAENDTVYEEKPAASYVVSARQVVTEIVHLPDSIPLKFEVRDSSGDGFAKIGATNNDGYVKIFEGPAIADNLLFTASGDFVEKFVVFNLTDFSNAPSMQPSSNATLSPSMKSTNAQLDSSTYLPLSKFPLLCLVNFLFWALV